MGEMRWRTLMSVSLCLILQRHTGDCLLGNVCRAGPVLPRRISFSADDIRCRRLGMADEGGEIRGDQRDPPSTPSGLRLDLFLFGDGTGFVLVVFADLLATAGTRDAVGHGGRRAFDIGFGGKGHVVHWRCADAL